MCSVIDLCKSSRNVLSAPNRIRWGGMKVVCSISDNKDCFMQFNLIGQEPMCGQSHTSGSSALGQRVALSSGALRVADVKE